MIIDMSYWTRVLRKILYVIFILIGLYLAFRLSIFYMPFLIAFIISLIIEPAIKLLMKKMKLTRRISSIIIFIIASVLIVGGLIWGLISLFSETSNLLKELNEYVEKIYIIFHNITNQFNKIHLPDEIINIVQNSTGGVINTISNWIRNSLIGLINIVTSIPTIAIYFAITIMALYLITIFEIS